MFLLQTLKSHLNDECAIVYREFSEICGTNVQAAQMLGKFAYWSDVKHRTEPQSCGWFYKTAQDLLKELGFTRRAYEKGRKFLIENGLVQYRRGGVHGKMHFCVNFARILELVYQIRGQKPPKDVLNTQIDIHNYQIPKWIPLDEWNAYLQFFKEKKGHFPNNKQKSTLIKQLAKLRSEWDLVQVIQRSIEHGWIYFYALNFQEKNTSLSKNDREAQAVYQAIQAQKQPKSEPKPQPSGNEQQHSSTNQKEILKSIMEALGRSKKW